MIMIIIVVVVVVVAIILLKSNDYNYNSNRNKNAIIKNYRKKLILTEVVTVELLILNTKCSSFGDSNLRQYK